MRTEYPVMCLSECADGESLDALVDNYKEKGFAIFYGTEQWALMRKGVYEVYIRRSPSPEATWEATVLQLRPGI